MLQVEDRQDKKTGALVQYRSFSVLKYVRVCFSRFSCFCTSCASTAVYALRDGATVPQAHCAASLFHNVAEGISLVFKSRHQALFLSRVLAARVLFGYILGWWLPLVWICFQLQEKFHRLHSALSCSQP